MIIIGSTYWSMLFGREKGEAIHEEEGMHTIRRFGENIVNLIIE
jgi:hypothetical protein